MPLHTPVHLHVLPIPYAPHMAWGLGRRLYTTYVLGSFRGISTSVRHFCVCQYIHLSSQFISHTSCFPSLWVASLLDWMSMDVCYASCCCSFLCSVFIMSQVSTTMAMTTTPPVTAVCSGMSSLLSVVTWPPPLWGFQQHQVSMMWFCCHCLHQGTLEVLLALPQEQPLSKMPLQANANYAMGPPEVGFSFRVEPPTILYFYMFGVCSGVCFLLSGAMLDAIFM